MITVAKRFALFAALLALAAPSAALAQTQAPAQATTTAKVITVATVNIYNAAIASQDGNKVFLSFDLSNRVNVQPDVRYSVKLISQTGQAQTQVAEKVYDEVVSLGENQTVHKQIEYDAPAYLTGQYQIWLFAKNEAGMTLALSNPGTVTLKGTGQYVALTGCYLRVAGEPASKIYAPAQGVDVKPSETLTGYCTATNHAKTAMALRPSFAVNYRTTFGPQVATSTGRESVSLKPGEIALESFVIPKPSEPQAYDATLTLVDASGQPQSDQAVFHFVVRGLSATIQNLRLDKDYYQKGDTAQVSFFWSSSADNFPGSRLGATGNGEMLASITITDASGRKCASLDQPLDQKQFIVSYKLPVSTDCRDPHVFVAIHTPDGKQLDSRDYAIKSTNTPKGSPLSATAIILIIVGILALAIAAYALIRYRSRRAVTLVLFFVLVIGASLTGGAHARADTYATFTARDSNGTPSSYVANLNKPNFLPGENVTVYGTATWLWCDNGSGNIGMWVTVNSQTRQLINLSKGAHQVYGQITFPVTYDTAAYTTTMGPPGCWWWLCTTTYSCPSGYTAIYTCIQPDYNPFTMGADGGCYQYSSSPLSCQGGISQATQNQIASYQAQGYSCTITNGTVTCDLGTNLGCHSNGCNWQYTQYWSTTMPVQTIPGGYAAEVSAYFQTGSAAAGTGAAYLGYTVLAPPTASVGWSPTSAVQGGSATLSWTSANATSGTYSCTGADPDSGSLSTVGSGNMRFTFPNAGTENCALTFTGPGGSVTKTASLPVAASCALPATLGGGTISSGQSVTAYQSSTVACGSACSAPETRTCTNGVLSGSNQYQSCSVNACPLCQISWSPATVATSQLSALSWSTDGVSAIRSCVGPVNLYSGPVPTTGSVPSFKSGTGGTETCTLRATGADGGTISCQASLTIASAGVCILPSTLWPLGNTTLASGQSVQAYQASSVACGSTCAAPETRTCTNGVLSGSYQYPSCSVAACGANASVTISATPTRVQSGQHAYLTWSGTNVTSCTVTGTNGFSQTGKAGTNVDAGAITTQTTFTANCDGNAATANVIVNVVGVYNEF